MQASWEIHYKGKNDGMLSGKQNIAALEEK